MIFTQVSSALTGPAPPRLAVKNASGQVVFLRRTMIMDTASSLGPEAIPRPPALGGSPADLTLGEELTVL